MNALRRHPAVAHTTAPSTRDTRDLLVLARTLHERARQLQARPDELRARVRRQFAELREHRAPEHGQIELLTTLSTLRRATEVTATLGPRIDALVAEIDELMAASGRAAHPLLMLLSRRRSRDAAQVAAAHLRRFMLSLSTLRLAGEIRRHSLELDSWQPDPLTLWQDYHEHAASYDVLLADLAMDQERA